MKSLLSACLIFLSLNASGQLFRAEEKPITGGWQMGFHDTNRGFGTSLHYLRGPESRQLVAGLDAHLVRDLREVRSESAFGQQGRKYVFGKLNNLVVLSPTVGYQVDLFPLGKGNLLNFRLGARVGPAIGLLNPYYLEIFVPVPNRPQLGDREVQPYDPAVHTYASIIGRAPVLNNSLDLDAQIGASGRVYGIIDFSNRTRTIRGVQLGVDVDWFAEPVPIMADFVEKRNNRLFIAASAGLLLGNRW